MRLQKRCHAAPGCQNLCTLCSVSRGCAGCQVVDFPDADGPLEFGYDEEWLAVLRSTHSLLSLRPSPVALPGARGLRCLEFCHGSVPS